jgi:hypothetical protein
MHGAYNVKVMHKLTVCALVRMPDRQMNQGSRCVDWVSLTNLLLLLLLLLLAAFVMDIYNYIPETNDISTVYGVAAFV